MKTITTFLLVTLISCNSRKPDTTKIIYHQDTVIIVGNYTIDVSGAHSGTSGYNDTITKVFTIWINPHDTTYVGYPLKTEKEK